MGSMIEITRPDGASAPGYLAEGTTAPNAPGVVMLEEWWGVTDEIVQCADRLAAHGFRVVIPDLFRGRVAATGDEANHLAQGLDFVDAATQDARGAAQFLARNGAKVGVLGFCMGGALALLCAMHVAEFSAAVAFYGFPPEEGGDLGSIRIPLQGHWAQRDAFFPIARVDQIEARLRDAKVSYEFHRYDAMHGFSNRAEVGHSGLGNYDEAAASLAWERSLEFLHRTLD